jgi:transmembrane sensor
VEAWRARKLDFSDTPLSEAIAEANRYSMVQIVLEAPAFKNERISGRFEAGRNDLFAEGLEGYFHFHVERSRDGQIVLTPSH